MNSAIQYSTFAAMIAAGLSDEAVTEHGRPLTRHIVEVGSDPIGPGVEGSFVMLKIYPEGFDYKAQVFGVDGNTLLARDEIEAKRTFLVTEAKAAAEASAQPAAPTTTGGQAR